MTMYRFTLFIFITFAFLSCNAQPSYNLSCLQGMWENITNGSNDDDNINFIIYRNNKSMSFGYNEAIESSGLYIWEFKDGFISYDATGNESININQLQREGDYYVFARIEHVGENGVVKFPFYQVASYFECEENSLTIAGNNPSEYIKIERLPSSALKLLYNRGKKEDKDYIEKYLDIKVKEVQVNKSIIYSEPGTATKMFLIKGDIATVLEEKGEWLKIEFLGKRLVTGWIKKEDVN